ncbi:unnamed protein product [Rhizophagus irregularis]|uniref:Phytase-like domain-containing protein n=1 Tax=Rhizophagus irregularis TaxID=588596 RepID=A0A916E986_9GLOM|nr:unnamed protein product [Rhizophagus irregularis]
MGSDWKVRDPSFAELPAGPGTGWFKRDRDSESMSIDRKTGAIWVGFESYNELWRYDSRFRRAEAHGAPPVMSKWPENEGPEAMTLLPTGGMVTIAETKPWPKASGRGGIVFLGDPVQRPRWGYRFNYLPPRGYDPSDMTLLPDGRWLILNRRLAGARFSNVLTVVDPAQPVAEVQARSGRAEAQPELRGVLRGGLRRGGQLLGDIALQATGAQRQLVVGRLDQPVVEAADMLDRTQAVRRHAQLDAGAERVGDQRDVLQVRQERALGLVVRVGNVVTHHPALAGQFADPRHRKFLNVREPMKRLVKAGRIPNAVRFSRPCRACRRCARLAGYAQDRYQGGLVADAQREWRQGTGSQRQYGDRRTRHRKQDDRSADGRHHHQDDFGTDAKGQ